MGKQMQNIPKNLKFQFVSDFHTEFWTFNKFERQLEIYLPRHADEAKTVLVCGGDMGLFAYYASTYKPLFNLLCKRFFAVVMVPGNHSWYNSAGIWGKEEDFWSGKKLPKNLHYLNNGIAVFGDYVVIGTCLWTDFNNSNPVSMFDASRRMADFDCIRKQNYEVTSTYGAVINSSRLRPEDTVEEHHHAVDYIRFQLETYRDKKCIIVTHHAPSYQSVDPEFRGNSLNPAYATELTDLMRFEPLVWCHGHMHRNHDYMVENTRVICNPLGYHATDINRGFNPALVLDL
jgi:predicted phosphohydrolase